MNQTDDGLQITTTGAKKQIPFLARNGLKLTGPVTAKAVLKTKEKGTISFSWRTSQQKEFAPENRAKIVLTETSDWQTVETTLPDETTIIHVRVHVPSDITVLKSLGLTSATGKSVTLVK